mgnify:CR=1 FL=1
MMLSKNLVLRKRCYYYGDTKIKTDSKIYLSKTKMELMKKNFFKVLDYVKSIFEEDIVAIDLETKERMIFGEQALIFRNSKNEDYLMKNSDKEKVAVNTLKKVVVAPQKIKSLVLVKEIFLTTDVNRKN